MQPGNLDYAKVAIEEGRVFFDVYHYAMANTQTRIPGYFIMFGGPSFGPNALVKIIKHYRWSKVALYYQNAPSEVVTADTFVSLALLEGVEFELQKRESSTEEGRKIDYEDLQAARSNIYIFFGGSQLKAPTAPPATICALSCAMREIVTSYSEYAGAGCFNDRSRKLAANRAEIAIICCCTPSLTVRGLPPITQRTSNW